jgi:hypothetical protein
MDYMFIFPRADVTFSMADSESESLEDFDYFLVALVNAFTILLLELVDF